MKPFEELGRERTQDGRDLTFHRRDRDYFLYLDGEELMSTRRHHSEGEMARLALRGRQLSRPTVLIGGLGLGFTLRACLDELPKDGRVVVAELFGAVVRWNREHLEESAGALRDPRVEVVEADVAEVINGSRDRFDAMLLDVDNGPAAWCLEANTRIYTAEGLARIERALRQSGVLAVWSAFPDEGFVRQLESCGFRARAETVRARGAKGHRQTVFIGQLAG